MTNKKTVAKPLPLDTNCPIQATVNMIGGRYKALILWWLLKGKLRFSELSRKIPCATPRMLTTQLRELEKDGLLARKVYPVVPPMVEYSLTNLGTSLEPILSAMFEWGSSIVDVPRSYE